MLPSRAIEIEPALFRHDHRHGVVLLGETDGGAMARAELAAAGPADGQRRKQEAAAMRPSWMITAPSCSGAVGWKMLTSSS